MPRTRKLDIVIAGDAKPAQRAMEQTGRSGTKLGKKLEAASKSINRSFSGSDTVAYRFQKRMQGVSKSIGNGLKGAGRTAGHALKGITFGLLGVAAAGIAVGKSMFNAAEESIKVGKQTEAVIKSTGKAANVSAKYVADYAGRLSILTGVDDEVIQQGQNMLLTFTRIRNGQKKSNKIFDRATNILVDMSVAMKTDVRKQAIQLGKALNDPIKGITALTRVGVTFTEKQKDQIRWFEGTNQHMKAQALILDELNKEFGGSATAQATWSDRIRVAWGNIMEQGGTMIATVLTPLLTWVSTRMPAAMDWLQPKLDTLQAWLGVNAPKAMASVRQAWDEDLYPALVGIGHWIQTYVWPWVVKLNNVLGPKGLAYIAGTLLVGALAAYTAATLAAAVANIIAYWPIYAILLVLALQAAALVYAEKKWHLLSKGVRGAQRLFDTAKTSAELLGTTIAALTADIGNLIGAFKRLTGMKGLSNLLGGGGKGGGLNIGDLLKVPVVGGLGSIVTGGLSGLIPGAAEGAFVRHTPGGSLLNVGEGPHDEIVMPLDGQHSFGDTYHLHFHGPVSRDAEAWVVDMINKAQRKGKRIR